MFKFETISETISRLLYIGIEKQRVQHFFCTKFLNKSGARSAYTEWLIPLECLASTFLPLLSLPGTLSFGTGWRSTTSLTRCLMSAHLRASRQVDPHLYPDLWCLDTDVDASPACRECDEDVGKGAIFSYVENLLFCILRR